MFFFIEGWKFMLNRLNCRQSECTDLFRLPACSHFIYPRPCPMHQVGQLSQPPSQSHCSMSHRTTPSQRHCMFHLTKPEAFAWARIGDFTVRVCPKEQNEEGKSYRMDSGRGGGGKHSEKVPTLFGRLISMHSALTRFRLRRLRGIRLLLPALSLA